MNGSPGSPQGAHPKLEPSWGLQAGFQFIFVCLLTTLLYSALTSNGGGNSNQPVPFLIELDHFLRDIVRRSNKFLDGDAVLRPNNLSASVGVWTLTALIANLLSGVLILATCLFGWRRERVKLRIIVAAFALTAIFITIFTAPLLYSTPYRINGSAIPMDAAVASLLIYICCLAIDVAGALDYPRCSPERTSYANFILGVDIPCIGVTALFSICALYISFPPEFVVGTVAALFVYYTLAFLLLSGYNWTNTTKGERMISKIKGNVILLIALGAALNGIIGTIVQLFKLPIYLDIAGSLIVGAVCGALPAMLSASLGVLILGLTTTPVAFAYMGTAVVTSGVAVFLMKYGFMRGWIRTGAYGLLILGPLSTILSVPVTVYLFGGVTFAGSDAVTLFFVKMGDTLLEATIKGAIGFDALDKCIAALIAYALYKRIPESLRKELQS